MFFVCWSACSVHGLLSRSAAWRAAASRSRRTCVIGCSQAVAGASAWEPPVSLPRARLGAMLPHRSGACLLSQPRVRSSLTLRPVKPGRSLPGLTSLLDGSSPSNNENAVGFARGGMFGPAHRRKHSSRMTGWRNQATGRPCRSPSMLDVGDTGNVKSVARSFARFVVSPACGPINCVATCFPDLVFMPITNALLPFRVPFLRVWFYQCPPITLVAIKRQPTRRITVDRDAHEEVLPLNSQSWLTCIGPSFLFQNVWIEVENQANGNVI